jgi:hypothetical protein
MSTEGPFLYDDRPPSPHTGTPRSRNGLLIAVFAGTVALAVAAVVAFVLVRGTPEDQAKEATGVFLAALQHGDAQTAHELLCEKERARIPVEGVAGEYAPRGAGRVVSAAEDVVGGRRVERVEVRWADGSTSGLVVVAEGGPRVCGTAG